MPKIKKRKGDRRGASQASSQQEDGKAMLLMVPSSPFEIANNRYSLRSRSNQKSDPLNISPLMLPPQQREVAALEPMGRIDGIKPFTSQRPSRPKSFNNDSPLEHEPCNHELSIQEPSDSGPSSHDTMRHDSANHEPYEYEPFPGDDYLRVLELQPGAGPLSCKLLPMELEHAARTYEAISYVWGDVSQTSNITCDGKMLSITQSLSDALHQIRDPMQAKALWADAICINQSDKKEQGHQVERMGKIYENAKKVLIWLGHDDGAAEDCFKLIIESNRYFETGIQRYGDLRRVPIPNDNPRVSLDQTEWDKVKKMLEYSWFKRVWVLQEVGLASFATIMYGDSTMNWSELVKLALLDMFRKDLWHLRGELRTGKIVSAYRALWNSYGNHQSWRSEVTTMEQGFRPFPVTILDILSIARFFEATDSRDYIYAFLGHPYARLPDGSQFVEVDYTKSVEDVYFEAASAMINYGLHPCITLTYVDHTLDSKSLFGSRPSWVPRWDEGGRVSRIGNIDNWYRAGGTLEVKFKAIVQSNQSLKLRGFIFDTIVHKSKVLHNKDFSIQTTVQSSGMLVPPIDSLWKEVEEWGLRKETDQDIQTLERQEDAFSLVLVAGNAFLSMRPAEDFIAMHRRRFAAYREAVRQPIRRAEATEEKQRAYALEYERKLTVTNRSFFCTQTGYYGIGHMTLEKGDLCCVFPGAPIPYILRPAAQSPGNYKLVAGCYIHGLMKGEVMEKLKSGEFQEEDIILV
ncbi:HET-domain-containing protein [Lophium mytilinum]|uniref:HET-domain-containing protein n=1 Tax=Lophium mytilinum TaxID=390894 RepID=A0A6A6R280_9PEZI|nr:HET-domain-containing protein [Lophium mytilinum]